MTDSGGRIEQLFEACDLDKSGFIEKDELLQLCADLQLTDQEFDEVFTELDKDGDGKINRQDFITGFESVNSLFNRGKRTDKEESQEEDEGGGGIRDRRLMEGWYNDELSPVAAWEKFLNDLELGYYLLSASSQEQVCDLYQQLHNSELPHVLAQFETVILSVIKDIRQHQYENERLERSYKREKDAHVRHMRQMEEEMEAQMSRVEARVRGEERERTESEKEDLRRELEAEIVELSMNLKKLQSLDDQLKQSPSDSLKARMDELNSENRQLKSHLTDASTNLAILRSEIATLRQQYEEKCEEVDSEKENLMEYIKEQDNLTRQVHLLHDANKKLHDTNDDLRAALESSRTCKRPYLGTRQRMRSRSAHAMPMADFMPSPIFFSRSNSSGGSSLAEELNNSMEPFGRKLLPSQESCEIDSIPEDMDSGHSTMRDSHDIDSEYEPMSITSIDEEMGYPPLKNSRRFRESDSTTGTESEVHDSHDEMEADPDDPDHPDDLDDHDGLNDNVDMEEAPVERSQESSIDSWSSSRESFRRQSTVRRRLPALPIQKPITSEPERMYKVVLAGDAAVGKSSFIMRLCKNKFVSNLHSTLGVDFQTKILEVDGRVIALQLWDTAGQERFRSIAKSYFRRADGVLLLYDCSYERSFINVREWTEAIEEGAQKNIPVMICGNKTDLRDDNMDEGKRFVKYEDGQRLAKQFNSLFIETSAKEGGNILEAVTELARLLRTNEDLEVKSVGMTLQDMKGKEPKKSCCN